MAIPTANEKIIALLKGAPDRPEPETAPKLEPFLPPQLTFLQSLIPGAKKRQQSLVQSAHDRYTQALARHESAERVRQSQWESANSKVQTHNEM